MNINAEILANEWITEYTIAYNEWVRNEGEPFLNYLDESNPGFQAEVFNKSTEDLVNEYRRNAVVYRDDADEMTETYERALELYTEWEQSTASGW